MKVKYLRLLFLILIIFFNLNCDLFKLPDEIPDDDYLIDYFDFETGYMGYERYLATHNNNFYFIDSSGDIFVLDYSVYHYYDYDDSGKITKYFIRSDFPELFGFSIIDMTIFKNISLITAKSIDSIKIILKPDAGDVKIYDLNLSQDITLSKGLKYYENGNYFIGVQSQIINDENFGKLIKIDYDSTGDQFVIDDKYPDILLKDITYYNIFGDGLWRYSLVESESRNRSSTRMSLVPYYKCSIYEYDLLNFRNNMSLEYYRRDNELIDIVFYDGEYIKLLSGRGTYRVDKFKVWR